MSAFIFFEISCKNTVIESPGGIFNGISNNGQYPGKPYLTAGDKSYIIGAQDGSFPDIGGHLQGEMGGFWTLPVKLLDGIWLKIAEPSADKKVLLLKASEFINYPQGNKFIYPNILSGIDAERFQFCLQGRRGMVIIFTLKNNSERERKQD